MVSPQAGCSSLLWHRLRRSEDHCPIPALSWFPACCPPLTTGSHSGRGSKVTFQHFTRSKSSPLSPFLSYEEIPGVNSSVHGISHRHEKALTSKPRTLSRTSARINSFHSLHTERVCSLPPQPTHTLHTEWLCNSRRNPCNSLPLLPCSSGLQPALLVTPNTRHWAAQPLQGLSGGCSTTGS